MCGHAPTRVLGEALRFGFCFLVLESLLEVPVECGESRWDLSFAFWFWDLCWDSLHLSARRVLGSGIVFSSVFWDLPVLGSVRSTRFLLLGFDFCFLVLGSANDLISPTLLRVNCRK